jgi:hypothetical protein
MTRINDIDKLKIVGQRYVDTKASQSQSEMPAGLARRRCESLAFSQ